MRKFAGDINQNLLGNIKYRNNVVTGVVAVDNGNYTYDVYISSSIEAYPNIPTTMREPDFAVGDAVEILIEYGNKEMPIIIGLAKKVVQEIQVIDINTLVTTLDAYDVTNLNAYLEGRIEEIDGYENCLLRGFHYGLTTSYGTNAYTTGSFEAGSYSLQTTGLLMNNIYNFQAYVLDADGDEQIGDNKTFITSTVTYFLFTCDYESGIISKHNGLSETILSTFLAPNTCPTGLCNDGVNLISCEDWDGKIYIHSGVTSGISSSFLSPSDDPSGLAYDGSNLISCDWHTGIIYIHNGVSSGVTSSFNSPSTGARFPRGLAVIGGNLISADANEDRIYIHSGISSGITSSFPSPLPQPNGLGNYGNNLLSADNGTYGVVDDHFYLHSGVSSGITNTYNCSTGYKRISGITYI
jgi:hypothetical protein